MMKNLKTKIFVAILAFTIGIFGVWASSILLSFPLFYAQPDHPWMEIDAIPTNEPYVEQTFGNVKIHYQRRLKIEGENYVEFEIVNRNSLPVGYIGYGKDSYCTTAVKISDRVEQHNQCWCGTGLEMQTLREGETALYQVSEIEVRQLLKREVLKVTKRYTESEGILVEQYIPDRRKVTTQIGFEFLVGAERHKELLWSEKVSFPK